MSVPKIELRDVHKAFGEKKVLDGLDLRVMPGESLVIIGGSGSGKSVTFRCILGIEKVDSGEVLLDGQMPTRRTRAAFIDRFGMLFQGAALFDSLPVWENVAFRLRHGKDRLGRAAARDLAVEKLAQVGLGAETADLYPAEISGGMQKRVGLARAIATDPTVMFFDEPTAGLDPIMAGVINQLIRKVVTDLGATALTITHDMSTVASVADSVAMLHDGKVRWQGSLAAMQTADDPLLHQFIHGRPDGPIPALR